MYSRWMIPKDNTFQPDGSTIASLIRELRREKWIVDPGAPSFASFRFVGAFEEPAAVTGGLSVLAVRKTPGADVARTESLPSDVSPEWLGARTVDDLRLVWPVDREEGALLYPLCWVPTAKVRDETVRYAIELHVSPNYVYPIATDIDRIPTDCACGEDLSFDWLDRGWASAFSESFGISAVCPTCGQAFDPRTVKATIIRPFDGGWEKISGGAAYRFAIKFRSEAFVPKPTLAFSPVFRCLVEDQLRQPFCEIGSLG